MDPRAPWARMSTEIGATGVDPQQNAGFENTETAPGTMCPSPTRPCRSVVSVDSRCVLRLRHTTASAGARHAEAQAKTQRVNGASAQTGSTPTEGNKDIQQHYEPYERRRAYMWRHCFGRSFAAVDVDKEAAGQVHAIGTHGGHVDKCRLFGRLSIRAACVLGLDLGSTGGWSKTGPGSIWGRSNTEPGSIWGRWGVDIGPVWCRFGVRPRPIRSRSAVDPELIGGRFRAGLGSTEDRSGVDMKSARSATRVSLTDE